MILLVGASGYVGQAFAKFFDKEQIPYKPVSVRYPVDRVILKEIIEKNNITDVINAAGYTGRPNIASCELPENKADCFFTNSYLPLVIQSVCEAAGVNFYHVSTGCLYTDINCDKGLVPSMVYNELYPSNFNFENANCSWYSGTKDLGEKLLHRKNKVQIWRLRLPFNGDVNPRNCLHKMVNFKKLLNTTNSYSNLNEFVSACYQCMQIRPYGSPGCKVFNLTQPGYITTREIVDILKSYKLVTEKEFFKDIDEFKALDSAPRANCVLSSDLITVLNIKMTPIHQSFSQAADEYLIQRNSSN